MGAGFGTRLAHSIATPDRSVERRSAESHAAGTSANRGRSETACRQRSNDLSASERACMFAYVHACMFADRHSCGRI
eukprot:1456519-Pleurochrysis_carterae.AAC.1